MDKKIISERFYEFLSHYSEDVKDEIWRGHSGKFREFWAQRIMDQKSADLDESEIDQVIRILDINGKGNSRLRDEAVARVMMPQGAWRRLFRELRQERTLRDLLDAIFRSTDDKEKGRLLDELYKKNEGRKNGLTGQSGNVVNALCFAYSPAQSLSVISLKDRRTIIEKFGIQGGPNFEKDSVGTKIVQSNRAIIEWFKSMGLGFKTRTISVFLYSPQFKDSWKGDQDSQALEGQSEPEVPEGKQSNDTDRGLFSMESELEDFLIEHWESTPLGKRFDLLVDKGEMVSQQFKTKVVGTMDILVMDKKTKEYVVIELKKNQTSDDTVGQLTRYMAWVEENLSNGVPSKGIIIAGSYDERLRYSLKKIPNTEVYLYRVDFKLEEFKRNSG